MRVKKKILILTVGTLFMAGYRKYTTKKMIDTDLTEKAMKIAYEAHAGQTDKAGKPYISHVFHVAKTMRSELSTCVALLHDVLEDTSVSLEELRMQGIPQEALEALILLTHKEEDTYEDYVKKLACNGIAKEVKIADLLHNSDLGRISNVTQADLRRVEKYKLALSFLLL